MISRNRNTGMTVRATRFNKGAVEIVFIKPHSILAAMSNMVVFYF